MKSLTKRMNEAEQSALQKEYSEYFNELLDSYGVKSPASLSPEKTAEFFNAIKDGWVKGKGRKS